MQILDLFFWWLAIFSPHILYFGGKYAENFTLSWEYWAVIGKQVCQII